MAEYSDNISVSIRVRPLNAKECAAHATEAWVSNEEAASIVSTGGTTASGNMFHFDHVFSKEETTAGVYDKVARPIVGSVLDGINGTLFAYGQTASGKTYTMTGSEESPGVLRLAAEHIFSEIAERSGHQFLLHVSFLEIYNEQIKDLLCEGNTGQTLRIREDRDKNFFVDNMTYVGIASVEELLELLARGEKLRHVGVTNMNEKSSRSHTIFSVKMESRVLSGDKHNRRLSEESDYGFGVLSSRLNLVDLAGSECVKNTGAAGARLKEGGNINKSLLTLSRVISQLASAKEGTFINFRDSKLTQILQPSIAGNCRTAVICCVSPANSYTEETRSTLKFATRAKQIRTKAVVNEILDGEGEMKKLKREVQQMKRQLQEQQQQHVGEELEAANHEKQLLNEKIQRLTTLIICGGEADSSTTFSQSQRRKRKYRETWCPGAGRERELLDARRMLREEGDIVHSERADFDSNESVPGVENAVSTQSNNHEEWRLLGLRRNLDAVRGELTTARKQVESLESNTNELTSKNAELDAELNDLRSENEVKKEAISSLHCILNEGADERENLDHRIGALELEVEAHKSKHEVQQRENADLLAQAAQTKEAMIQRFAELQRDRDSLALDISAKEAEISSRAAEVESARAAFDDSEAEITAIRADLHARDAELRAKRADFEALRIENNSLKAERDSMETRIAEGQCELRGTRSTCNELRQVLELHDQAHAAEWAKREAEMVKETNIISQRATDIERNLNDARAQIASLDRELKEERAAGNVRVVNAESTTEKLAAQLEVAETRLNMLSQSEETAQMRTRELEMICQEQKILHTKSVKQETERFSEAQRAFEKAVTEAGTLRDAMVLSEVRLETAKSKLDEQLAITNKVEERVVNLEGELEKNRSVAEMSKEEARRLGAELEIVNGKLSAQTDATEKVQHENASMTQALEEARAEIANIRKHADDEVAAAKHDRIALKGELSSELETLRSANSVVEEEKECLKAELERTRAQLLSLTKENDDAQIDAKATFLALENAREQVVALREDTNQIKASAEHERRLFEAKLKDELETLCSKSQSAEEEALRLGAELEIVNGKISAQTDATEKVQHENASMTQALEEARAEIANIRKHADDEVAAAKHDRIALKGELSSELETLRSANSVVEEEKECLKAELERTRAQLLSLTKENDDAQNDAKAKELKIEDTRLQLVALREDFDQAMVAVDQERVSLETAMQRKETEFQETLHSVEEELRQKIATCENLEVKLRDEAANCATLKDDLQRAMSKQSVLSGDKEKVELSKRELEEKLSNLQEERARITIDFQTTVDDLSSQLADVAHDRTNEWAEREAQYRSSIKNLQDTAETLQHRLCSAQTAEDSKNESIAQLETVAANFKKDHEALNLSKASLQREYDHLSQTSAELANKLTKREDEIEKITLRSTIAETNLQSLQLEKTSLYAEVRTLEAKIESRGIEQLKEREVHEREIETLNASLGELQQQLAELSKKGFVHLSAEEWAAVEERGRALKRNEERLLQDLQNERESTRNESVEFAKALKRAETQLKNIEAEKQELEKHLCDARYTTRNAIAAKDEAEALVSSKDQRVKKLERTKLSESECRKIMAMKKEHKQMKAREPKLKAEIERLKDELTSKCSSGDEVEALRKANKAAAAENKRLASALSVLNDRVQAMKKSPKNADSAKIGERELLSAQIRIEELQQELGDVRDKAARELKQIEDEGKQSMRFLEKENLDLLVQVRKLQEGGVGDVNCRKENVNPQLEPILNDAPVMASLNNVKNFPKSDFESTSLKTSTPAAKQHPACEESTVDDDAENCKTQ